jgi:hypothetical protein
MTLQILLAGFLFDSSATQDYKGWEAEGLRKKRKYASILFSLLLKLLPLQLFQDHRDGNLETLGMTMARGFHQAVPSSFQVTVPVGNI